MRACSFGVLIRFITVFALVVAPQARGSDSSYIPYDVTDAVRELDHILEPAAKAQLHSKPIGMQVRNRWELWNGDSRLAQYFFVKGIYNADVMWEIIVQAYEAKISGKTFKLRRALREALVTYGSWTNIPKDMGQVPTDFDRLRISHYIQRDDLSAVHVFSTSNGEAAWVFIRGAGWFKPDATIKEKLGSPDAIVVQHLTAQEPPVDPKVLEPFKK